MASVPVEGQSLTTQATASENEIAGDSSVILVNNDPGGEVTVIKPENKPVVYTMTSDHATASTQSVPAPSPLVAPSSTSAGNFTIDGTQFLPMMNLSSLQAAGFPVSAANSNPTAIPMMIQGVGGSGALTFIYPAALMANTSTTVSTNTQNADLTGLISQTDTTANPPGIITVVPQAETSVPAPVVNETATTAASQSSTSKLSPPVMLHRDMIDLSELTGAAGISNIHSAITNQIILGIKTEGVLPDVDHTEETSTSLDATESLHSPPTSDVDEGSVCSKAKRAKMSGLSKEDKICKVCGDKALGCNFDAISCESCKAFFRRNALKDKQPKCLFDGNCAIDVNTRRFCPFCRLQKCFVIGMKRELILGDNEKKKRNEKVKMNREKRLSTKGPHSYSSSSTLLGPLTPGTPASPAIDDEASNPPEFAGTSHEVVIEPLGSQSPKQEQSPTPTSSPATLVGSLGVTLGGMSFSMAGGSFPHVNNLSTPTPDVTNLLSLSKLAQKNEISSSVQLDSFLVRRLTAEENHMLQELMQVYHLSFTADLEPLIHIKHLDPSLNQLVNQSSITVLRLIKFAKRLEEFIRLTQECQIGILKGTWIHILLLRSVSLYDSERDVWVTPKGDIPTEILKNATGFVKLHDDHVCYCKNIKSIIRDDLMIVVILLVIVLFSPEGPNVINRELVSNIQDKYLILLKHYLESKYTYVRAADMFPALMSKLKELKELAEIHGKYLLDVNPGEIEPIMLEILDLK